MPMDKTSRILVTGEERHLGFNLAKTLHQQGYNVRVTVRNKDDPEKTSRLRTAAVNKVSKVILTSSAVTLPFAKPGEPIPDETDWDPDPALAYRRAKIAGERLA